MACLLPEDRADGASEGGAESVVPLAGESEELLRAKFLFGCGHSGLDLKSFGAFALAIGEDVQLAPRLLFEESQRLSVMLGQFASHTRNDIDTDESIGDQLVDELESLGKECCVVVPSHQAQHLVGA